MASSPWKPVRAAVPSWAMGFILGASFWASAEQAPAAPARVYPGAGRSCLTAECHGELRERPFVHAPLIQADCVPCHDDGREAEARHAADPKTNPLAVPKAVIGLCGRCHRRLATPSPYVHAPFEGPCTVCHDPHGGAIRYFLKADSPGDLCLKCHGDLLEKKPFLHSPAAGKDCLACHAPHASDFSGLLSRPPDRLCIHCHFRMKEQMDKAASVHRPVRDDCEACHNPHGGTSADFLPEKGRALCHGCHGELFQRMESAKYPHAVMIEGKECSDCHDPHDSAWTRLLIRPSMDICLDCHERSVETKDNRLLPPVGEHIAASRYRHGPIRQKDCTPCHAAHGNNDPRLMTAAFPEGFYASYHKGAYALCFRCHDALIVEEKRTTATGFRNGDLNLHYVHVHREKGRSCRACHDEHASNSPFQIRDFLPFGESRLKIEFLAKPTGGTCLTGCHEQRSYSRTPEPGLPPTATPVGRTNREGRPRTSTGRADAPAPLSTPFLESTSDRPGARHHPPAGG